VEASAQQLALVETMSPYASVVLNIAPDHLDYFESMDDYRQAKARVYERTQVATLWNDTDPGTLRMLEAADVVEGCRAIGFTVATPSPSMIGIQDELVLDRAFLVERRTHAIELCEVSDIRPMAAHNVLNAMAAAGLARSLDVAPSAVKQGLRDFQPAPHRIATVAIVDEVTFINDSKATNEHAAGMSLSSYSSVIWIAGGLAKGQDFAPLVRKYATNIKAVILIGRERELIASALREHAPQVPIFEISDAPAESIMKEVVQQARAQAAPGDTVLLAPGCSSWDLFPGGYAQRGEAFEAAVRSAVSQSTVGQV
ncbi:MAG: UDP-N-acetylmuramoyl-L-alanine--D-glutamate ligase, partial [Actinomycetes bacterium]